MISDNDSVVTDEARLGPALEMRNIRKSFPGTVAVDGVDFAVAAGEIHALVGENGAGKSTLMKILAGSFADYEGEIRIRNRPVTLHSPAAARQHGVGMIYQELSLARPISIAENIMAGRLPVKRLGALDRRRRDTLTRWALERVGLDLDPATTVEDLSQHEAQLVEIAKVLDVSPCILVMDEPTSALSRDEVERLFGIIRKLKSQGLAIVYISHHLPEIFSLADRVTVLRDGKRIATRTLGVVTQADLVEMMVGRADAGRRKTGGSTIHSSRLFPRCIVYRAIRRNPRYRGAGGRRPNRARARPGGDRSGQPGGAAA